MTDATQSDETKLDETKLDETKNDETKEEVASNSSCDLQYALVFHGGAGNISTAAHNSKKRIPLFDKLKEIIKCAYKYCEMGLQGELTAVDIVEKVIILMEDSPFFNCGKGSVFNKSGKHEMEASIMNGKDLKCGAVSLLNNIKNPISVAVDIMNTTNHIYLVGNGAKQHIKTLLLDTNTNNYYDTSKRTPASFENDGYFYTDKRWNAYEKVKIQNERQLTNKTMRSEDEDQLNQFENTTQKFDGIDDGMFEGNTVGCVVMLRGNVAAGTSTGGVTYKLDGRIGDTPIIGSGTYANNKYGAISCTGNGEEFMRHVTAYDIIARVKYCKISLQNAIEQHLNECFETGIGGAVSVDDNGTFGIGFNTNGMIRGYFNSKNKFGNIAILKDDTQTVYFENNDADEDVNNDVNENPYLDTSLMQVFQQFSPQQNQQFVSGHSVDTTKSNQNENNTKQ